ncbi:50S ribosomal protein L11 [Candidatus Methanocrinis natronophilus]|uniref:50S ribosomal protein L11 n=1 Tax=Candidatus Methanocrinis natronophilus TaxID=3033396 RepID=UPI003743C2F8
MANFIEVLVPGGKASAGPPLGPALGPLGVNVAEVVKKINEATADLNGMQVPVKVTVKSRTEYHVDVGTPPTSALVLKEAGLEKGSANALQAVGNLTMDQVIKVAGIKKNNLLSVSLKGAAKEVIGTCGTMGITVEGMPRKEAQAAVDEGRFDDLLA